MYIDVCAVLFSVIVVGVLGQTVEQPDLSFTKGEGRRAYISCKVNGLLSDNYVHWYQQKEGEALTRILYVNKGASSTVYNPDLLDAKGFSVKLGNNDDYVLRIDAVKLSHEGVYYCACWDTSGIKVFGAGTRLYVQDNKVQAPTLSVYPIVKQSNGKSMLLCQARDMYPSLVRFKWTEGSSNAEGDLMEQNDTSTVTSMLIVDEDKAKNNEYTCIVQHEGSVNDNKLVISKEDGKPPTTESPNGDVPTCSPSPGRKEEESTNFVSSELVHRLYLFNLTYVSLLVKNVLYFCAVGVLLYKRRAGNSETFSKPSPTSN